MSTRSISSSTQVGDVLVAGRLAQHAEAAVARQAVVHAVGRHPGEDDDRQARPPVGDVGDQREPVHDRHREVRDQHVDLPLLQHGDGLAAVGGRDDVEHGQDGGEAVRQHVQRAGIVIDDEDGLPPAHWRSLRKPRVRMPPGWRLLACCAMNNPIRATSTGFPEVGGADGGRLRGEGQALRAAVERAVRLQVQRDALQVLARLQGVDVAEELVLVAATRSPSNSRRM
jgi:hypothetical protein